MYNPERKRKYNCFKIHQDKKESKHNRLAKIITPLIQLLSIDLNINTNPQQFSRLIKINTST